MDGSRSTLDLAEALSPIALREWVRGEIGTQLPDPIWVRGDAAAALGERIAIVGARAASAAALQFSSQLARRLAQQGRVIVSGGALGVDGAAHEGALAGGGRTIVVLGTGIDVAYPERHAPLFARVLATGVLLSPFPPGTVARPGHFPTRNPIIAALADAVVVVEASLRSGSLGTAAAARRLGRPLWARPGSPGCDALIARGHARPAPEADALAAILLRQSPPPAPSLPEDLVALHAAIDGTPLTPEALAAQRQVSLPEVLAGLCELELHHRAIRLEDGRYLALPGTADLKE